MLGPAQVDFILSECNSTLARKMNHSHVRAAWAGLRPLVKDPNADPAETKKISRDHVVDVVHAPACPRGSRSVCDLS